jgi:hypothetical protein
MISAGVTAVLGTRRHTGIVAFVQIAFQLVIGELAVIALELLIRRCFP